MVRNDTGVFEGGEISIYYDPMIAKLVTHAPTRIEAIEAQARALDAFAIDGIRHNIPFLATLMGQERWRSARLSTGYIAEEFPEGFALAAPRGDLARRIALVAFAVDHVQNLRKRAISDQMEGWRTVTFETERVVMLGDQEFAGTVAGALDLVSVAFDDGTVAEVVSDWRPGQAVWRGLVDGERIAVQVRPIQNGVTLAHAGTHAAARVYTRREAELAAKMPAKLAADTSKVLLCPMPGLVKAISVSAGQEIKAGEQLCIVEAMKMENVLRAERDGTVAKVNAREGDSLAVDAVIMEFA
jgi:propionyl-CoA carboxylase alpha chain